MSSLVVFNRVYRLERPWVMLLFSIQLCSYCPSNILSRSPPPPLPPSLAGGRGVVWCWDVLEFNTLHLTGNRTYKIALPPKQKHRRGGGLRQINTCCQVHLQVNCKEKPTFSIWSLLVIWSMEVPFLLKATKSGY